MRNRPEIEGEQDTDRPITDHGSTRSGSARRGRPGPAGQASPHPFAFRRGVFMNDQRAQQKEKLVADIKTVMAELDDLVRDSASDVGDDLVELKGKLRDQVDAARQTL